MSLTYKGFTGRVSYDEETDLFMGEVIDLRHLVAFEGRTIDELRANFERAVDGYHDWCRARGLNPQRQFTGRWEVNVPQALHRRAVVSAEAAGMTLNQWIAGLIDRAARQ